MEKSIGKKYLHYRHCGVKMDKKPVTVNCNWGLSSKMFFCANSTTVQPLECNTEQLRFWRLDTSFIKLYNIRLELEYDFGINFKNIKVDLFLTAEFTHIFANFSLRWSMCFFFTFTFYVIFLVCICNALMHFMHVVLHNMVDISIVKC